MGNGGRESGDWVVEPCSESKVGQGGRQSGCSGSLNLTRNVMHSRAGGKLQKR